MFTKAQRVKCFFDFINMQLVPLKRTLEQEPTLLRVYRSISTEFNFTESEWAKLCHKVTQTYSEIGGPAPEKVYQPNIFRPKFTEKVRKYPVEFIPVMINIINEYLKK